MLFVCFWPFWTQLCVVDSHLEQLGSSPAVYKVRMEANVQSGDKLLWVEI